MHEIKSGLLYFPDFFSRPEQEALVAALRDCVRAAPLFTPRMPGTGKPFSVRMTNCGALGWMSDMERGYRYGPLHPATGAPWPPIPDLALKAWTQAGRYRAPPEACLVNFYAAGARMSLHQDRDEAALDAPVVSISLGDSCLFRFGGAARSDKTKSMRLHSGDVLIIGGAARLAYHGVDRLIPAASGLLDGGGRINLTLRRVNKPDD